LFLSLLTIACSDCWATSFRELAWSMVGLPQVTTTGCVIQITVSCRFGFLYHWTFPTCSGGLSIRSLNASSTILNLISLAGVASTSAGDICCSLLNVINILFKGISNLRRVLLPAWFLSIVCSVLSSTCCCRTRRSILRGSWLLLRCVQWASLIILPCLLPIARWCSMNILLGTSVSGRWMHSMVTMLGWVAVIVLRRWNGSPTRRMSRRTTFDFASGEFFQVSNAWLEAFYTLLLSSHWMPSGANSRPLTARLLRWIATRRTPSWLSYILLRWLSSSTRRASGHGEITRCIIVFWIVVHI
jgi:hypothetical protein